MGRQNDTALFPPAFWSALEAIPGGNAQRTIWFRHLGPDLETFQQLFLRPVPSPPADAVPCPWNCGCNHKVVRFNSEILHGICQCNPQRCQTYTVVPEERVTWELDWPKLSRSLCQAFKLQHKIVKLGFYNTLQIGTLSLDGPALHSARDEGGIPAILTLPSNPVEFLNILAVLVSRFGRPFILLAPTAKPLGPGAKDLLSTTGSLFVSLSDHLALQSSTFDVQGSMFYLVSRTSPSSLFADLAPALSDPSDEELARRVCTIIDVLDSESRRKSPNLLTIFRLYCVQEMTVEKIARKCKCSKATVSNRLKLLESKTGVPASRLRRISSYFTKLHDDLDSARHDYFK